MMQKTQLSPRQRAVLGALTSGLNQKETAETVGLSRATVNRYAQDPLFQAALRDAESEMLGQLSRRLIYGADDMLDVLAQLAKDQQTPAAVRCRAVQVWLDNKWRARDQFELEERMAAIERKLEDEKKGKNPGAA